jgi:hypothetical protein
MCFRPRPLSWSLSATLVCGLALAMGCAGAGTSPTGAGGSASPGTAGSSSPGSAGSASPGTAGSSSGGTTGAGGATGAGGTSTGAGGSDTGSGGSAGSATTGTGGVAGTSSGAGGVSSGGSGGSSSGSAGSSNTGAAGTVTTGTGGATGAGGTGGMCQTAKIVYVPKTPTVYLVVDRSGSMFHCIVGGELVCSDKADTSWTKLKEAIQTVVMQLQADVRFGFTTIFGTNPAGSGGSCTLATAGTLADNVPPKLNNYTDIKAKYDSLSAMWPNPSDAMNTGKKLESPAMYAIRATTKALMADTTQGDKFMIFLTDGQEDYCDDALEICASDSTVGALQAAAAVNIKTIVFGLKTTQFNLPNGVLEAFANAGAGESTVAGLMGTLDTTAIFDQCQGVMPWRTDLTASGHPTTRGPTATVGTYGTTRGPTTPFAPNAGDQTMLVTQLSQALAGVKSCTFDLNDVDGKMIRVDTSRLAQAHVLINGTEIMLSTTNGWNVDAAAPNQLVFSGSACDTWRKPSSTDINLQFPCGTIIFE